MTSTENPSKQMHFVHDVAIIGGGAAGTMAHLRAVLNMDHSLLFLGNSLNKKQARATWVFEVENIPGMHDLANPISDGTKKTLAWIEKHRTLHSYSDVRKTGVFD
ncbi:MAG: hypothetical protein R3A11_02815 [Bdellovibrionota bacterium]